jgi:hypothetical protein
VIREHKLDPFMQSLDSRVVHQLDVDREPRVLALRRVLRGRAFEADSRS